MKYNTELNKMMEPDNSFNRNYQLIWNQDSLMGGRIQINHLKSNKEAHGNFKVENDILKININATTYSKSYLKKNILNDLINSTEIPLNNVLIEFNLPSINKTVSTRLYIDNPPAHEIDLNSDTYYYSVNNHDMVDCNGWTLKKAYKAKFQYQIDDKKCDSINLPALSYTVFKLISEI